jgi:riboflavin transporter 2
MQEKKWIKWQNNVDIRIFLLFIIFGISSWVTINAVFVELPTLAVTLPEGWDIGSRLAIAIQCANIPAFLYFIFSFKKWNLSLKCGAFSHLHLVIGILLALGFTSTFLMSFFWSHSVIIHSKPTSLPLIIFTFLGGIVDCTTSLVYWPFVSSYSDVYTSALAAGEGLSGAAVSVVGLIQNQGTSSRFSPSIFFILTSFWMILSGVAFGGLLYLKKKQATSIQDDIQASESLIKPKRTVGSSGIIVSPSRSIRDNWWLFVLQFVINSISNGLLPSLCTFAFFNYKDGKLAMSLAINISLITNPLAALVSALYKCRPWLLVVFTSVAMVLSSFMVWVSAASPHPPLQDNHYAAWLMFCNVLVITILVSYSKAVIFMHLKEPNSELNVELSGQ